MLGASRSSAELPLKDEELTHMLNVSECQAVFVSDRYVELVNRIRPTAPPCKTSSITVPPLKGNLSLTIVAAASDDLDRSR